jgi:hypothetical protein
LTKDAVTCRTVRVVYGISLESHCFGIGCYGFGVLLGNKELVTPFLERLCTFELFLKASISK